MKKHNNHNWKNELRNRSIKPSEEAWLAVESGLEQKSKHKLKKRFAYILIAASFLGFVITISLPTNSVTTSTQSISAEKQQNQNIEQNSNAIEENTQNNEAIVNSEFDADSTSKSVHKQDTHQTPNHQVAESSPKQTQQNAISSENQKSSETKKNKLNASNVIEISPKAMDLLAEVEAELAGQSSTSLPLNAEDEAKLLLAEAKQVIQDVKYQQLYEMAKANDLLAEVEDDYTKQDLQQRVWRFVKTNYHNLENTLASLK